VFLLPNGGHQALVVGTPLTLGNGKLLRSPPLIGLAERVGCIPPDHITARAIHAIGTDG